MSWDNQAAVKFIELELVIEDDTLLERLLSPDPNSKVWSSNHPGNAGTKAGGIIGLTVRCKIRKATAGT